MTTAARHALEGLDPNAYVEGDDGLPARKVGTWSARKHHFLDRYMRIFSVGMNRKWGGKVSYLELFAGPGRWYDKDRHRFERGSPLLALDHPFGRAVFVDLERRACDALEQRLSAHANAGIATVIQGDCNTLIDQVVSCLPSRGLTLAFIDPTNWQVRFDTIRRLVDGRKVDIILTFHDGNLKRVAHLPQPHVDEFFGTTAWRQGPYVRGDGSVTAEGLIACFRAQMAGLGYLDRVVSQPPVRNSRDAVMYHLAFFSKHRLGYRFWDEACAVQEDEQLALNLR